MHSPSRWKDCFSRWKSMTINTTSAAFTDLELGDVHEIPVQWGSLRYHHKDNYIVEQYLVPSRLLLRRSSTIKSETTTTISRPASWPSISQQWPQQLKEWTTGHDPIAIIEGVVESGLLYLEETRDSISVGVLFANADSFPLFAFSSCRARRLRFCISMLSLGAGSVHRLLFRV